MEEMKEGSPMKATSMPLNTPKIMPTTTHMISASHSGQPKVTSRRPAIRPEQTITGPMEKSMPPVAMTKVTPRARKPR